MAEANADIVRRLYGAFNAGEPARDLLDPDIEYVNPRDAVEPGTRHGVEQWAEAMRNIGEAFSDAEIEVEHLVESRDRVAAVVRMRMHARASGLETTLRQSHLWTIRDGRAVRLEWFNEPDRAEAAIERER